MASTYYPTEPWSYLPTRRFNFTLYRHELLTFEAAARGENAARYCWHRDTEIRDPVPDQITGTWTRIGIESSPFFRVSDPLILVKLTATVQRWTLPMLLCARTLCLCTEDAQMFRINLFFKQETDG